MSGVVLDGMEVEDRFYEDIVQYRRMSHYSFLLTRDVVAGENNAQSLYLLDPNSCPPDGSDFQMASEIKVRQFYLTCYDL